MAEGESHFQILPAIGANLWVTCIAVPAIETGGQRRGGLGFLFPGQEFLLSLSVDEVEGEKDDKNKRNPYSPEKTAPDGVSPILGIVKNPYGNDQIDKRHKIYHV